jgi:hypothetical protein
MKVSRWTKTRKRAVPITTSGVISVERASAFAGFEARPRQRVMPMASATPMGTAIAIASPASLRLWKSAERRSGSCQTEPSGSSQYQRKDHPCAVERERPSLKEKRMAMRTGTIAHVM